MMIVPYASASCFWLAVLALVLVVTMGVAVENPPVEIEVEGDETGEVGEAADGGEAGERSKIRDAKTCRKYLQKAQSVASFKLVAREVLQQLEGGLLTRADVDKCIRSKDGVADLRGVLALVDRLETVHSVCEPDYIDKLLAMSDQMMMANVKHGQWMKRKLTNILDYMFRMLAGQVMIVCKRSLAAKLEEAEASGEPVVSALALVDEAVKRREAEGDSQHDWSGMFSEGIGRVAALVAKHFPSQVTRPEMLMLLDMVKPSQDSLLTVGVTVNNLEKLASFVAKQKACKVIERYARASAYPITRLAWKGLMAHIEPDRMTSQGCQVGCNGKSTGKRKRGELLRSDELDTELERDERVQRWLRTIQYCQGVLVARVHIDFDQATPVELSSIVVEDRHTVALELSRPAEESQKQQQQEAPQEAERKWHRFVARRETFEQFEPNLRVYTLSSGLVDWMVRQVVSESEIARVLTVYTRDDSFRRSIAGEGVEEERQIVRFAGTAPTKATLILPRSLPSTVSSILLAATSAADDSLGGHIKGAILTVTVLFVGLIAVLIAALSHSHRFHSQYM